MNAFYSKEGLSREAANHKTFSTELESKAAERKATAAPHRSGSPSSNREEVDHNGKWRRLRRMRGSIIHGVAIQPSTITSAPYSPHRLSGIFPLNSPMGMSFKGKIHTASPLRVHSNCCWSGRHPCPHNHPFYASGHTKAYWFIHRCSKVLTADVLQWLWKLVIE